MDTRDEIIDTAADLFSEFGYGMVTTDRIAERARVNESTIFRIFGSKSELARAVMENEFERRLDPVFSPEMVERLDLRALARWCVFKRERTNEIRQRL